MKATKTNFEALLAGLGGSHDVPEHSETGNQWSMNIDAPAGHVWASQYLHCVVATGFDKPELWADAIGLINYGLELCTDTDCETCNPE